jgi:ABC-type multidrug transport system ATPase subunit
MYICVYLFFKGPNGAGKSTFLSALSGKLNPAEGKRLEGDGLALGVFTQDLAQDLDQEASAVEVVTRNVRQYDPTLSDEKARSVLGALGLTGEKSLRKVGHLSGGEKARVALASFVLIPHNLLLLDEPSNHLDVATLEVLTKSLRDFAGSIVVISHDRHFLEELSPTHVINIRSGKVEMEERSLREEDWNDPLFSREAAASSCSTETPAIENSVVNKSQNSKVDSNRGEVINDSKDKNVTKNALKKIQKIENSIDKLNEELSKIDEEMLNNGKDRQKLMELQKEKDKINVKLEKFYLDLEEQMNLV